jgi:hypothetical protein
VWVGSGIDVGLGDGVTVAVGSEAVVEKVPASAVNIVVLNPGTGVSGAQALANKMIKSRKLDCFITVTVIP